MGHDGVLHIIRDRGKDSWNGVIDIWIFPETVNWHIKQDKMKKSFKLEHIQNTPQCVRIIRVDFFKGMFIEKFVMQMHI